MDAASTQGASIREYAASERTGRGRFSFLLCLPNVLADDPSVGTGTVMRPDVLRRFATEAGFSRVDVLPIEADFWRFYRLVP